MSSKIIVVLADDKITKSLFSTVNFEENVILVLDRSSNIRRVKKLILRGSLPLFSVFKMLFADILRRNIDLKVPVLSIANNTDLLNLYEEYSPSQIILFSAGLIVKRDKFPADFDLLNIHCASIPSYGGLASIYRAIKNKDFSQKATLHRVTNKIDEGEVLKELPYEMTPTNSYRKNEDIAYKAGFDLLIEVLKTRGNGQYD